jgi:SPP1 family predicted phage head-tail adaptor
MRAGDLDTRVEILRSADIDDGISTTKSDFASIATRWAARLDISDRERLIASQQGADVTTRFRMRWDSVTSTITADDRLRDADATYEIIGKPKRIGRRKGVEITACSI